MPNSSHVEWARATLAEFMAAQGKKQTRQRSAIVDVFLDVGLCKKFTTSITFEVFTNFMHIFSMTVKLGFRDKRFTT